VTCRGETFASRVSASQLQAVGLPDLVTDSLADYEALALSLARDLSRLDRYRRHLAAGRDTFALFDSVGYARALEALLLSVLEERSA
jgi:predicted O-linked N-acetylglucosamine transferase (SPINDLY family)